jgi:uncharacterized RDD family membrane protein YckC
VTDPQGYPNQEWYPADARDRAPAPVALAAWSRRLVALIIDNTLLYAVTTVIALQRTSSAAVGDVRFAAELALSFLYFGYLNGVHGQTVGKRLLHIRVVDADTGLQIGFRRGLARYGVVALLSMAFVVPALIDGLWPLRDPRRQAWHDKAVRSLVIDTRS